ncbi:MAG: hypothetical protein AABY95_07090 [Pseudomonadota bacterium]
MQAASPQIETSAAGFLSRPEIVLPPRSQVIKSVDLAGGCGIAPSDGGRQVDGRAEDWKGSPTEIAGTHRYDAGEYLWSDFPFDDAGDGAFQYPGEATPIVAQDGTAGTASELMQRYGANAADVVEFRAAADASTLYLLVRLNFLNALNSTVVGLGFDLDRNSATGFTAWPRGANIDSAGRGLDLFITAFGACAYVTTPAGEQALDAQGGAIHTGTRDNVMEIALPLALLNGAQVFDVVGGSGLWDAAAQSWMPVAMSGSGANANPTPRGKNTAGAPEVFNLMFRDDEASINACAGVVNTDANCMPASFHSFQARNQVQALRAGTSGPYAAQLDLARLQPGASSDPQVIRRGAETFFTRVYRSRIDAEGVLLSGNNAVFTSRYQPYTLYVPACFEQGCAQWPDPARAPLALQLHGGGNDHLSASPRPSIPEGGNALYGSEDFFAAYDRESAALIASPLGRGLQLPSWRGYGEADVLEVLDSVRATYRSDSERQGIIGGSQGGFGTFRMAGFYPDLWNSVSVECPVANEASSSNPQGHVVPSTVPFVIDVLIPALINLPYLQGSGTLDPLAPITMNQRLRDAALAAGLDVKYTEYLAGSHCFDVAQAAYPYTNADAAAAARALLLPRLAQPARVRYRIDPRQYPPAAFNGLFDIRDVGVSYAGANWVFGLRMRPDIESLAASGGAPGGTDETSLGDFTAVSHALPGWQITLEDCVEGLPVGIAGVAGGNPQSEPLLFSPNAYQCQRQVRGGEFAPLLELSARNLEAAAVDLAAAGLADQAFAVQAQGDGAFELHLTASALRNAGGACVQKFTAESESAILHLQLSANLCEIRLEP